MVVRGEVDLATAPKLQQALADRLSHGPPSILRLDLSGVSFMDSTGLHALLVAQRAARLLGGDLVLVAISPQVTRLLEITGIAFTAEAESMV